MQRLWAPASVATLLLLVATAVGCDSDGARGITAGADTRQDATDTQSQSDASDSDTAPEEDTAPTPDSVAGADTVAAADAHDAVEDTAVEDTTPRDTTEFEPPSCMPTAEVEASCDDGLDDDCNDAIDCADPACGTVATCTCGDATLDEASGEQCDDNNSCTGDGCDGCVAETTLVTIALEIDGDYGFDLDNDDGDDNPFTGIDNAFGAIFGGLLGGLAGDAADFSERIANGDVLALWTVRGIDSLSNDDEIEVTAYRGVDPGCPRADGETVPWYDQSVDDAVVYAHSGSFNACTPPLRVTDADDPANGIYGTNTRRNEPAAPFFYMHAPVLTLELAFGTFTMHQAYVAGSLLASQGELTGIVDGRVGGVLTAETLYQFDLSNVDFGDFKENCPTALHAALGLIGDLDQDAEGNGSVDEIDYTVAGLLGFPCVQRKVTINYCCDEGRCRDGGKIDGADCVLNPRIGDGFSFGAFIELNTVRVTGQVDGNAHCP